MTGPNLIKFTNCKILKNHEIIQDDLWVKSGVIINPETNFYFDKLTPNVTYDMNDLLLAPGFIDLQINGGFGVDFNHNLFNSIETDIGRVAFGLLSHGVTAFCPTVVSSQPEVYQEVLPKLKKRKGSKQTGAEILGVHLEGPFIDLDKRGAHFDHNVRDIDSGSKSLLDVYGNLNNVSIVTLAPEKTNAIEIIDYLISKNIKVSMGHSSANYVRGLEAITHGVNLITHLFNAMNRFHHRDPGIVGLIGEEQFNKMYYSIIADGVHVHPAAMKLAYRANPDGVILITDAISAMDSPIDTTHTIGDQIIEIKDNRAYIANTETLAGSIATMNQCVKTFQESTDCTLASALEAASLHPAQYLDVGKFKGTFEFGADADIVCLDSNMNVASTWISGECVYKNDSIGTFRTRNKQPSGEIKLTKSVIKIM